MRYKKKPFSVQAIQLKGPIIIPFFDEDNDRVETRDITGKANDWLITFDNGHQAVMNNEKFQEEYEPEIAEKSKAARKPKADSTEPGSLAERVDAGQGSVSVSRPKRGGPAKEPT